MCAKNARFRDSLMGQPQDVDHTLPLGIVPTEEKRWCLMRTMQSTGADTVPSQFGDAASCCPSLAVDIDEGLFTTSGVEGSCGWIRLAL